MMDYDHSSLSVRKQSQLLSLSRSSLYYASKSQPDDSILANAIHDIWLDMPFYGYRRITAALQRKGISVNGKRVLRIMHDMKIHALYPRPRTSIPASNHQKYPYLLKDAPADWCTCILHALKQPKVI